MKTLKLTMVAALVAFLMVNVASADGITEKPKIKKCVNITVDQAMKDPGLLAAMYEQVGPEILRFPLPPIVAEVKYNGSLYRISGTRQDWLRFFRAEIYPPSQSFDIHNMKETE
jgi:hypothetical protein